MSHGIESMFSVKQTPWHGLGRIVQDAPNCEEAIKLAGLDWHIEQKQVHAFFGERGIQFKQDPSKLANVRMDNLEILGIVGKNYRPLQNKDAFKFFDQYVDAGLCKFETAGALWNGRRVWILAEISGSPLEIVKDDYVKKYLLLSNGHDGTHSVKVGFTPVRVVCANTLAAADSSKASQFLRVRHGQKTTQALDNIKEVINLANAQFEATAQKYKRLSRFYVNANDIKSYVKEVFEFKDTESQRSQNRQDEIEKRIIQLFQHGKGQDIQGAEGTYWGLYNAVTEYITHEAGIDENTHLNSIWFGKLKKTNEQALNTAMRMAI